MIKLDKGVAVLKSKSISLYFCSLTQSLTKSQRHQLQYLLSPDEEVKAERARTDTDKLQREVVRGVLRLLLSKHGHLAPQDWRFEYGEKGKPRLTQEQQAIAKIDFNMSHSGDWLLVGIIDGVCEPCEFGVDIERERENTNIYPILNHYFAKPEVDELMSLPESVRRERFFDLWALKEAYIKAKGLGLALSLQSFWFDFNEAKKGHLSLLNKGEQITELPLDVDIKLNKDESSARLTPEESWHIGLGRLNEEYRFGIALNGSGHDLSLEMASAERVDIIELLQVHES